jgi:hypothetical protein
MKREHVLASTLLYSHPRALHCGPTSVGTTMHCAIDRNACSQAIICIANNSEIINCNNNVWLVAAAIMQNSYCNDRNFDNVLKLESTLFQGLSYTQGRINHVADAAYAAGLTLMGASCFTVPRPFLREHAYFLLGHAHFRCIANLDASRI